MGTNIRETVRERYAEKATLPEDGCCSCDDAVAVSDQARALGYADEDIQTVPEGANLGLGCGNPLALEQLRPGDTVLDLGSGGGFDCFLAAKGVGPHGRVIGVDMTQEMIDRANENRAKFGADNVEFRLGYIEDLPVDADSVDLIISNCVINLSPDKQKVFDEAFRVLKSGGTLSVSDVVLLRKLPWFVRRSIDAYIGCVAGAALKEDYLEFLHNTGFHDVSVVKETCVSDIFPESDPTVQSLLKAIPLPNSLIRNLSDRYGASIHVTAVKPVLN